MNFSYAKSEIDRYLSIGVDRSDVALLVSSWGFCKEDMESLNLYLHESETKLIPKLIKTSQRI